MPISQEFTDATMELLNSVAEVTYKKMFGGACLYFDGLVFGILDNDKLYFKINDANISYYESLGMSQLCPGGDPSMLMPYFEVPGAVQSDPDLLKSWLDKSVEVARSKKKRSSKK